MLYPSTCQFAVRAPQTPLEVFLMGLLASLSAKSKHLSRHGRAFHFSAHRAITGTGTCPITSPLVITLFGNFLLCIITYASASSHTHLLTLGGLALPRNLGVYGGHVFMSLVTHASILTSGRSTVGYPQLLQPCKLSYQYKVPRSPLRCNA